MNERRLYLAYGSNLGAQMLYRCSGTVFKGTTRIENYRLIFRSKGHSAGVATIEPYPESNVPVAIWEISPTHEQMLDRYEGVDSGIYHKKDFKIEMNGQLQDGFAYVMTGGKTSLPNHFYYSTILEGYIERGFDFVILSQAIKNSNTDLPTAKSGCKTNLL